MPDHTSTAEWQSFEIRMRRRRLERCIGVWRDALERGDLATAGTAEQEIRRLDPRALPPVDWRPDDRPRRDHAPGPASLAGEHRAEPARPAQPVESTFAPPPRPRIVLGLLLSSAAALAVLALSLTPESKSDRRPEETRASAQMPAAPPPAPGPTGVPARPAYSVSSAPEAAAETAAEDAADEEPAAAASPPAAELPPPAPPAHAAAPAAPPPPSPSEERRTESSPVATTGAGRPAQTALARREPPPGPAASSASGRTSAPETAAARPEPRPALEPDLAPSAAASASSAAVMPEVQVQQALRQYGAAYSALDARAARAIWPAVDERALARAFASLDSQQVVFDRCDVEVAGRTARASCTGRATYVPKVGRREPQTEPRSWTFALRQDGADWKIERADVRRQ